jgi:hypothetical protein
MEHLVPRPDADQAAVGEAAEEADRRGLLRVVELEVQRVEDGTAFQPLIRL